MAFTVGETVVYPHHGAAHIEAIETRKIKGVDRTYLLLKVVDAAVGLRVTDEYGPAHTATLAALTALAPALAAQLAPGGVVLLSGILTPQEEEVRAAYLGE